MPRYDFRCPHGHVTEHTCSMADVPTTLPCAGEHTSVSIMSADELPAEGVGPAVTLRDAYECLAEAERIFHVPAAIHFKGPGFYATDVKGRLERKRRKMPSDGLRAGDMDTTRIARSL